jgi:PTH1 family peptidyl-tRNA hydrolase
LGNPTDKYAYTRHNVGFDALTKIAASCNLKIRRRCFRPYRYAHLNIENVKSTLVQPLTYMNRSGEILKYFLPKYYKGEDLIVICDNLDLPPGMIRVRQGGTGGGHRGLKSIEEHLGTNSFTRIYIGIGRPTRPTTVIEHVLSRPASLEEQSELLKGIEIASEAVVKLLNQVSVEELMSVYNRKTTL